MLGGRAEDELLPGVRRLDRLEALQQLLPQRHEGLPRLSHRNTATVGPVYR